MRIFPFSNFGKQRNCQKLNNCKLRQLYNKNTIWSAKTILMNKLNNIQSIGSFLRTKNGFKVTNPEGYVAIKKSGAVKLVDRLEFSRANFNMSKNWVKG